MTTTVLFAPGYAEAPLQEADYAPLIGEIRGREYKVTFLQLDWLDGLRACRETLEEAYSRCSEPPILAGHSFGAYLSAIVAGTKLPAALWLFAPSARWAEDVPRFTEEVTASLTPQLIRELKQYHFSKVVPRIQCGTLVFTGTQDTGDPLMLPRAAQLAQAVPRARLFRIEGMGHIPDHPSLLRLVQESI